MQIDGYSDNKLCQLHEKFFMINFVIWTKVTVFKVINEIVPNEKLNSFYLWKLWKGIGYLFCYEYFS